VRSIVEAAAKLDIGTLTLYAFSSDNWKRPIVEVNALMDLFLSRLPSEAEECRRNNIRLNVIGRRDRISPALRAAIEQAEARTLCGDRMQLRLAIDYSARDAILQAAYLLFLSGHQSVNRDAFSHALGVCSHSDVVAPDVDLLIRTGGEQRLSDFLLWESAYAELYFTETKWPDFTPEHLIEAVEVFQGRHRRFGGIPAGVRHSEAA
jgi:undecaprenyl diphosphate synthase